MAPHGHMVARKTGKGSQGVWCKMGGTTPKGVDHTLVSSLAVRGLWPTLLTRPNAISELDQRVAVLACVIVSCAGTCEKACSRRGTPEPQKEAKPSKGEEVSGRDHRPH